MVEGGFVKYEDVGEGCEDEINDGTKDPREIPIENGSLANERTVYIPCN